VRGGQDKGRSAEMARGIETCKADVTVIAVQSASLARNSSETVTRCGLNTKLVVMRKLFGRKERHVNQKHQQRNSMSKLFAQCLSEYL
ncbi:MAG TPA: hypothetical protein VMC85_11265, partial [Desulfomonilaceae bacterium]|nr:hypothetical protein [Desulfomonilaceae bacterium]